MANPNLQASSVAGAPDKEFENSIRPSAIRDFSGQPQLIENPFSRTPGSGKNDAKPDSCQ